MKKLVLLTLSLFIAALFTAHSQERATAVATTTPNATKHYLGMIEIGYLYGRSSNPNLSSSLASPTVQMYNGYRFHRMLALGATVGFDFYDNVLVTPLALGIRGELIDSRVSPVYGIDIGYGSTFLSDESSQVEHDGGWMFSPSLGIRVNTANSTAFTFNVGYKRQRVRTEANSWGGSMIEQKINYKRLSLRMGFMF